MWPSTCGTTCPGSGATSWTRWVRARPGGTVPQNVRIWVLLLRFLCVFLAFFFFLAEEYTCLWQECGFCSPESPADLVRHVYFHCYHTKLKQWGLRALRAQPDVSRCQLDFQSRNIIPEIQENFLCLWEYCEVRAPRSSAVPEARGRRSAPPLPRGGVCTRVRVRAVCWLRPA